MSAGIGYTGWSFVRNGGFSDAASLQISATKKCLTQKTENMDGKPDGDIMSELSEEKTSKSVYNEATRKLSTQKTENLDGKLDQDNKSKLIAEMMSKSVYNEATKKLSTQNLDRKLDQGNMSKLIEETTSKFVYNEVERARISAMFEQWIIHHNRMYRSAGEKQLRFGIFYSNIKRIEAHNSSCDGCKLGLIPFTDLTEREFRRKYCSGRGARWIISTLTIYIFNSVL